MGRYKTVDRKINKVARKLNKQLKQDELWRGRFELRQIQKTLQIFSDGSRMGYYKYRLWDKKTKKYEDSEWLSEFQLLKSWWLGVFINDAIVKGFKVWEFDRDDVNYPYNDKTDYTKISL